MRPFLLACRTFPLWVVAAASPAAAHAILMDSEPPALGTVPPGPTHVVLRFNSRIDQARSRLELRSADAKPDAPPVPPVTVQPSPADTLATDLPLSAGSWVLRWQVLAVDGHITRGEVPFTVRTP